MTRKTRIHYPGALYHVMLRGNARQTVFYQDAEYRYFEDILAQGLEQFEIVLHAYCWMKNHVHMALQVREKPLSKLMQNISQRYTWWFNKRHDRVGHVFQGRYKAVLVDKDAYLAELIRYIHLNPVRAGLVTDPMDYPWSSHGAYAGNTRPPDWLKIDRGLGQFGQTEPEARAAYLHFMGQTTTEALLDQLRHGSRTEGRVLGDEDFIHAALRRGDDTVQAWITIEQLVDVVAWAYKVSPREMISASRARRLAQARAMTALVGMDHCGHLLSDFSRYFNRNMPAMSKQVKALRDRLEKNRSIREKKSFIKHQIMG